MKTSVSIIIPAWNEERIILKTCLFLKKLKLPFNYSELIFIAGGNDNTFNICKEIKLENFNKVIILKQNLKDYKSGALIKGIKKSIGDFIILIDADVFVAPNLAIEIVKALKEFDVVNCDFIPLLQKGFWYDYFMIFKLNWSRNPNNLLSLVGGATISLRREIIDEIGVENFFSNKTTAGVDYYMGQVLRSYNKKMGLVKSTKVIMPRPNNIRDFSKDRFRWYKAFFSIYKKKRWIFLKIIIPILLFILIPPILILSIIKKMIRFPEKNYPKLKYFFTFLFIEYLLNILRIIVSIGIITGKLKPIGHFKGEDRYIVG